MLSLGWVLSCGMNPDRPPEARLQQPQTPKTVVADGRRVIVALGDSLTAGYRLAPEDSFPAQLQRRIDAAGYPYRVVNAGVSGDTTAQGLNRLAAVRELNPEIVILALGSNDGLRGTPVAAIRSNLEKIIAELQQDGVRVLLAGLQIPPNYGPAYTKDFRDIYPALSQQYRLPTVPFLLEGVGGVAALNLDDGIHPNTQGYERVAANVWAVLEPMLN